jgi:hypothetical protein
MRSAPFWRLTFFPKLTQGLQLTDIQIEQPTYECLSSAFKRDLPKGLASLEQYTLSRAVSEIPGLGTRALVDLLTALHFHTTDIPVAEEAGDRLNLAQPEWFPMGLRVVGHNVVDQTPLSGRSK